MESSFTYIISHLGMVDVLFLLLVAVVTIYFAIIRQVPYLVFILILSASLVGTTIPILGNIAPVIRWLAMFVLFFMGLSRGKLDLSVGYLFFWGYVFIGLLSLLQAVLIGYQIQRSVLLIIAATLSPLVFSKRDFQSLKLSLEAISVAAAIFCIINSLSLPDALGISGRFSGLVKSAASFALTLGELLVFTLWGVWRAKGWVRILCSLGFITGIVTLVFSGQRTGTIGGLLALVPLYLLMQNRKTIGWSLAFTFTMLAALILTFAFTDASRIDFLLWRFNPEYGLSGRDWVWQLAISAIYQSPIVGRGTGASEMFFVSSFHNAYLEVWYNTGFLGLLFYVLSQLYFFYKAISMAFGNYSMEIRAAGMLALGYMIGFVAINFFESIGAGASSVSLLLYLFLCFLVSQKYQPQPVSDQSVFKEHLLYALN